MYPDIPDEAMVLRGAFLTGLSDDEFFDFCQGNDLARIERLANREIVVKPAAGASNSLLNGRAFMALRGWQPQGAGWVLGSSVGYALPDGSVLSPSASWVSAARLAPLSRAQRQKFPPLCPDFVTEIKAPTDRLTTLQAKMEQWLQSGVRLGFLINAETETAYIYCPGQPAETVQGFDQELSGEDVLPGFQLALHELRPQS